MIIRPATEADIGPLANLAAASYRAAFLTILGEEGLALRQTAFFLGRFNEQWSSLRVADQDGRLIGFHQVREGMLNMLFLDPALTGNGIGQKLLKNAEQRGAVRLECFRDNTGARRFYERAGWQLDEQYSREFAGRELAFVTYRKPRLF